MIQLDILRHGETELTCENAAILRGQLDDALTDSGWQQMQQVFDGYCIKADWQMMVSSPLQRCAAFARQQAQQYELPMLMMDELQEMDFGDWEGQSTQTLYEKDPDALTRFWQSPSQFTPPNAEPFEHFVQRIQHALFAIYEYCVVYNLQRVCMVSHAGVIKLLKCLAQQQRLDEILTQSAELGQLHHFQFKVQQQELILECR